MISFFRKNLGLITILFLVLLPVARWAMLLPLEYRIFDMSATMTSLGQITGLAGMVMFSISLILGARLRFLDKYFYGLDKIYQNHHIFGALSFSLILFHPLFLVFKYIQFSLRDAAMFFMPSTNIPIGYGIISLFLMIVLMVLTFYIPLRYERWKISHKFLVLVFLFAILHTFYISSDVSRDSILRVYILGLSAFGLAAGLWRSFAYKAFNENFDYEIIKITAFNTGILEIEMSPRNRKIEYEAGQFIFVSFASWKVNAEVHPFSISSPPSAENLRITVKALGDFTSEMKNLRVGDKVSVEGPFGEFSYKKALSKKQIWIAGGIGITPFLSMAGDLKANDGYEVDLYYCTKNNTEAVLINELLKTASENRNFKLFSWCSEEKGYISAQAISDGSGGLQDKDIFLCGPPVVIASLSGQFEKMGVNKDRIHWENFNFKQGT
jgi:predicted ferric reductase